LYLRSAVTIGPCFRSPAGAIKQQSHQVHPTDEDDQHGHFFFNHPEKGGLLRCLGARSHCYCCLDPIPPLRGGKEILMWLDTTPARIRPQPALTAVNKSQDTLTPSRST